MCNYEFLIDDEEQLSQKLHEIKTKSEKCCYDIKKLIPVSQLLYPLVLMGFKKI